MHQNMVGGGSGKGEVINLSERRPIVQNDMPLPKEDLTLSNGKILPVDGKLNDLEAAEFEGIIRNIHSKDGIEIPPKPSSDAWIADPSLEDLLKHPTEDIKDWLEGN